ncbi:MAG TPA: DUF4365 domain-containing protein [Gemmataceae bacterium]|jgi:hypothetical protein|nr:DUF4365 domain-containing protein [Gemmataceae bacterium]
MTLANGKTKQLIRQRARALAIMYLTRHEDLGIEEPRADFGLDLIVRFRHKRNPGLRQFGVEVKAAREAVTKSQADRLLAQALRKIPRFGLFPFPVALFFFTMENDRGWFTWAAEPAIDPTGKPRLHLHTMPDSKALDHESVEEIVRKVDRWYDCFFGILITGGPGNKVAK